MMDFIKGADLSTMKELAELGARYFDNGREHPLLSILKSYGINSARLRLFNDPFSETGEPYGAGTNDLRRTIAMAREVMQEGLSWYLDIQYSDFLADSTKQIKPKIWQGLSYHELLNAVEDYTFDTVQKLLEEKTRPFMISIGNEIDHGFLWDYGKAPDEKQTAGLVSAGIRGARKADPSVLLMLHLSDGGNNAFCREWFESYFGNNGEDFDVIGLSFDPLRQETIQALGDNMAELSERYKKDVLLAEASMSFSAETGRSYPGLPWPISEQGQADFMQELFRVMKAVPDERCRGFYYRDASWIPVNERGIVTDAGRGYLDVAEAEEGTNRALFDHHGNALPALKVIRDCS